MIESATKKIVVAIIAVSALAVGGVATAKFNKNGNDKMISRVSEKLDLNDQQEQQLANILKETREYRQKIYDQTRDEVRATLSKDSLSKEDALGLLKMHQQRHDDMQEYMAEKLSDFHAVLTKEQRQKATDVLLSFVSRGHMGHHGKHGKHGDHGNKWNHEEH
ncbi:Spy/CpxP family protein refolding chaperone [Candidatus Persebacteraceae bacterium Df01]|jgi:Spy/CpxP family protein refolding chaperone|uniref:Spy/CpxP family protein refolding chaperone n=1 Tax=Candidatus Doriopsillibacter californiensis TaxID=2970740 RepID=A0ABT7QKN0_9GAMM|nr:Spy/CpxP family protein refolding chaperone [Candidatus Persebacteraceae bacterium Df01]